MTSAHSILRSLVIYAVCIPLAVFLGYILSNPLDLGTFLTLTIVLSVLCVPLLFRIHYPLMLLSWNTTAVLFFLPGRPSLWLGAVAVSFAISFSERILNREVRSIRVPELTRPLIVLAIVILITAELTGGIGLRAFGGATYGGKRYFMLFFAILGYFALTSHRIPRERVALYVGLFFLGTTSSLIGDFFPVLGSTMPFLFWFIPPYSLSASDFDVGLTRFAGLSSASAAIFAYLMARYGIRGIFDSSRPWRLVAFVSFSFMGLLGGFRSMLICLMATFAIQFFLEGLHRTKLLPTMILFVSLLGAALLPFAGKLPTTVQRSLAFLPVEIDPAMRESARHSSDWRLKMWKAVLPQVPQYLFLGKGLGISRDDYDFGMQFESRAISEDQSGSALAGDYHNGPLSVIIPFGMWGVLALLWLFAAGFRVLYKNYRYGDPAVRIVNGFLLADFTVRVLMFIFIVGGFASDILHFSGVLGLSVALNGGVARPAPAPELEEKPARGLATVLPRQRAVFGR